MSIGVTPARALRSVSRAIADFARTEADGSLDLTCGDATAIVHFAGGCLRSAESSVAPGIAQRLIGAGLLRRATWNELRSSADGGELAELLVEHGSIERAQLDAVTRSVVVDALLELAAGPGDVLVTPLGDRSDWFRSPARLDVDDVLREVSDRSSERHEVSPRRVVTMTAPPARQVVLTSSQWRVACHIHPGSTVDDIARESGLALYEVRSGVAELARAGLCVLTEPAPLVLPDLPPAPRPAPRPRPGTTAPSPVDGSRSGGTGQELPRRVPGASSHPAASSTPGTLPAHDLLGQPFAEPDAQTLQQLLLGLRHIE